VDSLQGRCYTPADGQAERGSGGVSLRPDGCPPRGCACGRFPLRHVAAVLILVGAIVLSACGGGGKEEEAAKEGAPEAAATAIATPEEGVATVTSGPAEAFAKLKSYRMNMRFVLEGTATETPGALALDLEGAFVAPDRSQTHVNARVGELQLEEESISVSGQTWVKTGDNWVEGEPKFQLSDLSPGSLLAELGPEQLRLLKPSKETVNGVDSLHYSLDRADVETMRSLGALLGQDGSSENLPEEFSVGLWLAEDGGWPVRVTMTARGAMDGGNEMSLDFSVDITDVNDPGIKIEPPLA
jgi:hypothetical protein